MSTYPWDYRIERISTMSSNTWYNSSHSPFLTRVHGGQSERPLAHLVEKENLLKVEKEKPSGGMPKEIILFDPKELVL